MNTLITKELIALDGSHSETQANAKITATRHEMVNLIYTDDLPDRKISRILKIPIGRVNLKRRAAIRALNNYLTKIN